MWENFGMLPPMFEVVLVSMAIILPIVVITEIIKAVRGRNR